MRRLAGSRFKNIITAISSGWPGWLGMLVAWRLQRKIIKIMGNCWVGSLCRQAGMCSVEHYHHLNDRYRILFLTQMQKSSMLQEHYNMRRASTAFSNTVSESAKYACSASCLQLPHNSYDVFCNCNNDTSRRCTCNCRTAPRYTRSCRATRYCQSLSGSLRLAARFLHGK